MNRALDIQTKGERVGENWVKSPIRPTHRVLKYQGLQSYLHGYDINKLYTFQNLLDKHEKFVSKETVVLCRWGGGGWNVKICYQTSWWRSDFPTVKRNQTWRLERPLETSALWQMLWQMAEAHFSSLAKGSTLETPVSLSIHGWNFTLINLFHAKFFCLSVKHSNL